ncbi:hypothetical protein Poli38472_005965 [Pythium oligandrum]|uniref:ZNF598/HEL2 PAH domain-containing protein n=1 Tax=Pythium oligandrum TaxID=41045 RepID=A0A8K1CRI6_PYTOL|nr:hypothetical protein Poli38472_005965 [Pythium oligandrum]|eukprot:TMW68497.1 hypothetical protein Poli38472_005965 [Pythium oligandrum]
MTSGAMASMAAKKKRRRMKQMEGLLFVTRPRVEELVDSGHAKARAIKMKKVHVMLQPQQLELSYSAQEDQEMTEILGRVDLNGAKLEQVADGFMIHEAGHGKKLKLHDKDKATIDAWFYAVYAAITEFSPLPVPVQPGDSPRFSAALTSTHRDEATDVVEYELSCQVVVPSRDLDEPSIRWKIWRTAADIQTFDEHLRGQSTIPTHILRGAVFPRERKRDSLFGGLRKKSLQEVRQQQLAMYIENIFSLSEVSTDPLGSAFVRNFLRFDVFFVFQSSETLEDDGKDNMHAPESVEGSYRPGPMSEDSFHHDDNQSSEDGHSVMDHAQFHSPEQHHDEGLSRRSSRRPPSLPLDEVLEEVLEVEPESDPIAAKKLHKQILRTVRELVSGDEDRVREFQDQTKEFGRGQASATEYCAFLHGALGSKNCCELIPMMARLLPDIEKREELLAARAAIIRRRQRRHRRRSKQFSESVVLQQQHRLAQEANQWHSGAKSRPKSDSLTAIAPSDRPRIWHRSSMVESHTLPSYQTTESNVPRDRNLMRASSARMSLPDARRKLDSRPSLSIFGEAINDPIEEEPQSAWNEDEENEERRASPSGEAVEADVKAMPPILRQASLSGNPWIQQPRSSLSGYGPRAALERTSSSGYQNYEAAAGDQYEHEQNLPPAGEPVVENPVLARLKKQGAVNFMLR